MNRRLVGAMVAVALIFALVGLGQAAGMQTVGLRTNIANGASTNNINHGNLSGVDWATFTVGGWWMPVVVTLNQRALWSKGVSAGARLHVQQESGVLGSLSMLWLRSGGSVIYVTNGGYLVANHPVCVFVTGNQAGAANEIFHMYVGDLTSPLTEVGYASRADNSGTFTSIAARPFRVNSDEVPGSAFSGVVFSTWVFENRLLEKDAMQELCGNYGAGRAMHPSLMARQGTNGTGRVLDESGNGFIGTITGAVPANFTLPRVGLRHPGLDPR